MAFSVPRLGAVGGLLDAWPRRWTYPVMFALTTCLLPPAVFALIWVVDNLSTPLWGTAGECINCARYSLLAGALLATVAGVGGYRLGRAFDRERQAASTDPLTGMPNRRSLDHEVASRRQPNPRFDGTFCVLALDLDRLKVINDHLGHAAGDRALCAVAESIQESVRPIDIAARIGGDEFCVILPQTPLGDALKVAQRIERAVQTHLGPWTHPLSVSIGISVAQGELRDECNTGLRSADVALYLAKAAGGRHICALRTGKQAKQDGRLT